MLKLRHTLLSNKLYFVILLIVVVISVPRLLVKENSILDTDTKELTGTITNFTFDGNCLTLDLKISRFENTKATYHFKELSELLKIKKVLRLGDKISLTGNTKKPRERSVPNTFDYRHYLRIKHINYLFEGEKIVSLKRNNNVYYMLKNTIYNYINHFKSKSYIKMLLIGDTSEVNKEIIDSFRENGISHLFAISGTQVTLLAEIIIKSLKKMRCSEKLGYIMSNIFTFCYLFITNSPPAVLRAVLSFLLSSINKYNYFYISSVNIFLLTLAITLLINPFYIYDLGFLYSYIISFSLILCSKILDSSKKFKTLLLTSIISFLVSIPVSLYTFYQINVLSIIYNLFYVPFVNSILFPLAILTLIFPFLDNILLIFIRVLETTSTAISTISLGKLIFSKTIFIIYIIYFLVLYLLYHTRKKIFIIAFAVLLIFHYNIVTIFPKDYITMIDIGQGDSILISSKGKNMLIDTGGKMRYKGAKWEEVSSPANITDNITIPYLKSKGIRKLDYLVLTHGDYDHLGEAINILQKFRVDQIYINEGHINYYEREIIKKYNTNILKEKMIINLGNFSFQSLNKDLNDENDSSIILYGVYDAYQMLFMGDASTKSERELLKNYNLSKINFLKVGHHGSKTSTSEELLKTVKPDIALISAGVDNKFHHPHQVIIDRLLHYHIKYYLTSKVGSVEIYFSKNKYRIVPCIS